MDLQEGVRVAFGAGKTGVVRFVGETDFASGEWVGIELDRPEGKNNGELNGRVYFTCAPNHGLFVKKTMVRAVLSAASAAPKAPLSRRLSGVGSNATRRSSSIGATSSAVPGPTSNPTSSRLSAPKPRASMIAPSSRSSFAASATARSRLSLERGGNPTSSGDDQLAEARTKISKLEEELEQKNRHVEQLRQSVVVMKEAATANSEKIKLLEEQGQVEMHAVELTQDGDAEMEEVDETLSPQEELAQQIEIIREEAEEHVRSVRAELEDHITELQGEHEEQLDELRLENATQASEIKALEAEVAQQKSRIVAFTAAEQKKAEEVAMAVAKSSSGARKVETLEKQVAELQDMIEMMTLEKETIEMDKEIAEEHAEELQQEVEKLKATMALSATTGLDYPEGPSASAGDLADENNKLRAAVKMLHERASEEKADLSKKLRQAQRENAELVSLREEVEDLTTKKKKLETEAEELKEMLDVANAYETMVEDLTEKNLNLGEKLAELETTVQSLESLREVDQEMEHQHTEYEAELRDEIDSQRATLQELKQAASDQKTVLEDKERTIARFRDLAHSHREEIAQLKAKLRAESGAVESLKDTAHLALNQTMGLRALVAAAREHETEAAKQKIIADQARLENSFLRAVVPNSIFSETDQKVLRLRLTLGRIADDEKDDGASISAVSVEQLILGDKLAAVSCQAKEDLFMLECHLTTEDEFTQGCSALDSSQTTALESVLDSALSAFSEGALLNGRHAGDAASLYDRLLQTSEEWYTGRVIQVNSAVGAESFGARSAVIKLRSRKSVAKLAFSISSMVTFLRSTKRLLVSSEMPDDDQTAILRTELIPVLDRCLGELVSVLSVAQLFYRRAEIDLAPSDEDLDGLVAAGGEVVASILNYSTEAQSLSAALQSQLIHDGLLEHTKSAEELVQFTQQVVYDPTVAFKEKLSLLYKLVCRGAFTNAVAPRTRSEHPEGSNGRPQWRIRAQAIHQELVDASTLRSNLTEMTELCNALHQRIREFERADSQHRVVAQKLESQVLQLTESVASMTSEKSQLESQLTEEREQFDVALDESNKEKTLLNSLNRDLRKQLKRTSDAGSSAKGAGGAAGGAKGSVLKAADADAFRRAFHQLHSELHTIRSMLAKERLEKLLGSNAGLTRCTSSPKPSERFANSLKEVATFSRQVKAQLSMPRLVDLKHASTPTGSSAHAQLMTEKLQQSRAQRDLTALRARVGAAMREEGWGPDISNAITRGESVFGWQPPEMERPPVLLGRVKLGDTTTTGNAQPVQLVLNRSEVKHFSQALVC
ncbi:Glycoside hydrolase [Phytophthora megakarya]|uniref:Glycoside hydrolase n=1 Tax=Phytophthora megakarya TaxID=4795 RepID=A0A225VRA8_9STRA|nr:Glycoside hydrolase [Phytophthora megakarya]